MSARDLSKALTGWSASIDSNGEHWPGARAAASAYVIAEGGLVASVHLCTNPRRALEAGEDVPDTERNELAADIRDARVHLIAAAPALLEALELAEATIERLVAGNPAKTASVLGTLDVISAAKKQARGQR